MKKRRSILASRWKRRTTHVVLLNGDVSVLRASAHTFEHIPLHEQGLVCGVTMLMEVG
jgi:hypothetical protein